MHFVGVDIIELSRIERVMERWGDRFFQRIYTETELMLCSNKPNRLATRFAAKEAVMKALGTGTRGVGWREIEVLSESNGKPYIKLYGNARSKAEELGIGELAISLSDTHEYAVAFVVGGD